MSIPAPKPRLTGYSTTPKLDLMKISGACVKACLIRGFVLLKIEFYEDFRWLRQNVFDFTQHMVMPLPENLRHLQSGDGGNREGPAKKALCGWLGHTHRAEDEAEERKPVENGLGQPEQHGRRVGRTEAVCP